MLLPGKIALVTGAATGIGEGIARLFASHGAHVALTDIHGAGAASVAAAIRAEGGSAAAFTADVRRPAEIRAAVDATLQSHGRIDVLVNNAGIYPRQDFLALTEEEWDTMHDVNLKGVFHCIKAVAPGMVARGVGRIVNISSVTFFMGVPRLSHYVAAKGGVIGLTRSLAREFGPSGVYVNCITPGAIEVEMEKQVMTPDQAAAIMEQQCLRRRLQPLDIARVCLFLASELSDGMTGQVLNVDGGLMMP